MDNTGIANVTPAKAKSPTARSALVDARNKVTYAIRATIHEETSKTREDAQSALMRFEDVLRRPHKAGDVSAAIDEIARLSVAHIKALETHELAGER